MVDRLGRPGGPRFRVTRKTGSSNDRQDPLGNEELTGQTRWPARKRSQDQTGNGPSKDDLRKDSRQQHAEKQHLMRIKDKIFQPTTPKTFPKQRTFQQENNVPKKDNLRQSSTNPQKTGTEMKPPNLLNSYVRKLTEQSKESSSQQTIEKAGTGRSVMVSGANFGDQGGDGAAPARTASAPPARTASVPPAPPPAPVQQPAAQPPNRPIPPTPQKTLKIQRKNLGPEPIINNWVKASTDNRDRLGDCIFSAQGEIYIVFTDGEPKDDIPIIYEKESVKEYAKKPKNLIEDVFRKSLIIRNNEDFDGDANKDNVMEDPKFDKKMEATIKKAINCGDKFQETLKRKGVSGDVIRDVISGKNSTNIKLLTSQEKLVVLFAAIEVLHHDKNIDQSDIRLLQEIKVVLEAFKTIDTENSSSTIMTTLENGIYSNEGAKNNPFKDFINHALQLHQDKIQSFTEVHIGRLMVSNITCQIKSSAGATGIAGGIISPSVGGVTPINSPHVAVEAPAVANNQEELTKQLIEHLTKLKQEFNNHYDSLTVGQTSDADDSVRDEFREIVAEFKTITEEQLMGDQKSKLYELITKLYDWKIKSCDESDIAGNLNKLHDRIISTSSNQPMSRLELGKLINDLHKTAEELKLVEQSQAG